MKTRQHLRFICFFLLVSIGQYAPSLAQSENDAKPSISTIDDFDYWIDYNGKAGVVQANQELSKGSFKPSAYDHINFAIADSVVWLAFDIKPRKEIQYLSIGNESTVWQAALYAQDTLGQYQLVSEYDHLDATPQTTLLPFRSLGMQLPQSSPETYLLRLSARRHRNYTLKTGGLSEMTSYLIQKEIIPVAFIAFMLCIFIYNIFLFVSTRDLVFIPYLVYVLFVAFAVPFHGGYVIFSTKWMWQGVPFYTVWTSMGYLSGGIFAIMYLDLRKTAPLFAKSISLLMIILVVIVPLLDASLMVPIGSMAKIVSISSLLFNLNLWGAAVYVWVKGLANAQFYATGWLFAISSMVLFILSTNGIIPFNSFVEQSFYYGFAIEAVLFAFALGDRMNVLKKEKRELEIQHVSYITEQNRLLAKQSFMNSHLLRAPLSRIMGLTNLMKYPNSKEENDHFVELVEKSTVEMDDIAKKMSAMLEEHGYLDEYQEDFEEVKQSIYKDLDGDKN